MGVVPSVDYHARQLIPAELSMIAQSLGAFAGLVLAITASAAAQRASSAAFDVVVSPGLRSEPATGRVFVFLTRDGHGEPRLQAGGVVSVPFFGKDVERLRPGVPVVVDRRALG